MAMTTVRTREQKVADAKFAFDALRQELGSEDLRKLITNLATYPAPASDSSAETITAYAALVQGATQFAQIAAANDRTALTAAVHLMDSGVSHERPEDE